MADSSKKQKKTEKRKKSESTSDSDSGPEDRQPVQKKSKEAGSTLGKRMTDADGNEMLELGTMKFATVRSFKGKTFVDIREFYSDKNTGRMMPGKKGISLNLEQFRNLKDHGDEIEKKFASA